MSLSPREKLSAAILRALDPTVGIAPYFGAVLRGLVRREMTEENEAQMISYGQTPTIGVSANGVMTWSAKFVATVDVVDLALILVHEVMHVVLMHSDRAGRLGLPTDYIRSEEEMHKSQLWNLATDACINEELVKVGTGKLPGFCVMPEKLKQKPGLLAEERYALLLKDPPKPQDNGKGRTGNGQCGGCTRNPNPGEPKAGAGDDEGRSEAEMSRMRKEVAGAVQDAQAKGRGNIPASLQRWAAEFLAPPKVDWRTKLARIVRGAVASRSGAADFSWTRISRRQAGLGYGAGRPVLPSMCSPTPRVSVGIDTSGSMSEQDLAMSASELQGVLAAVGASVTVAVCDAQVHGIKSVKNISEGVAMLKGGGGTIMTPLFEAFDKMKEKPSVVIICTDGHIGDGYPETEPAGYKTIWVVVGKGGNVDCCPWGEIVHVVED